MNLAGTPPAILRVAFRLGYGLRRILPKQTSKSFGSRREQEASIERIYVINLDRKPDRWSRIKNELGRVRDRYGSELLNLTERHSAVDARSFLRDPHKDADVDPYYTLADQLFVEPQPRTLPTRFELDAPIGMSRAEVAVAKSHIEVWRRIAHGKHSHALILEDDVWFHPRFTHHLDNAWSLIANTGGGTDNIDLLYVSYTEAKYGAPKSFVSSHIFKPVKGLWNLSGYILSRQGAEKLLSLLPCQGPIDLWVNYHFDKLNVLATKRSFVNQRRDESSTNLYSILPTLSTIGAINSEGAALFNARPTQVPVFVFGPTNSGQSSVAMALSMLGYRCCSDLVGLPLCELKRLTEGSADRVFGAYVNVGCLQSRIEELRRSYPQAKFIVTQSSGSISTRVFEGVLARLDGADFIEFDPAGVNAWRILCEHLRCVPPLSPFPRVDDLGQRPIAEAREHPAIGQKCEIPKRDRSPWVVEPHHRDWPGIQLTPEAPEGEANWVEVGQVCAGLNPLDWPARSDTFPGNLALFRPANIDYGGADGTTIVVRQENLGVRQFSAGALTSNSEYSFGRFEATFQASNAPGVVTGFFLHRNSPHQEIDIEIAGNRPSRLLVNVFYNPGSAGAKFDYGYRGSPSHVELGFDASKGFHRYAIEWCPSEIRWFVDDVLIHRRVLWNPTPIPQLPMRLHFNTWPSRASQLAGRLNTRRLPAITQVQSIRASQHRSLIYRQETRRDRLSDPTTISGPRT